jgi:site-specific recombinase XerC
MVSVAILQSQPTPLSAYLARLAPSSQHTMTKLLNRIAELLGSSLSAEDFAWARLRYRDTFSLRQQLGLRFAPATANLALAALRGILRESWRLGQLTHEDFQRAIDLAAFRGQPRPAPALPCSELGKLLEHCARDRSPRGRRDLALLAALYMGGLRRAELTNLQVSDYRDGRLTVFGKGGRWRLVPLPVKASRR